MLSLSKKREGRTPRRARLSMRVKIFIAFLIFSAMVIGVMWLLQSTFMESLYRNVRLKETYKCAAALEESNVDDFKDRAEQLAERYNICVSVYEIRHRRGVQTVQAHVNDTCYIHSIATDAFLDALYAKASEDGVYVESVPTSPRFKGQPQADSEGDGSSIIYVSLVESGDTEYMLLFNTEIYPLASTVSTLRLMLVYASLILIAIAAILSIIVSWIMARPAVQMSREAAKLALGNYDVSFNGGGYKEMSDLADTLNRASSELSRLDRMQKDLIANVSHDLRTPLTLISGYSEVMRDIPGEMTPENMQIIIDETARLSSLVSDMLDMSRFMAGGQKLNLGEFSLTETVRESVNRYAKLREREGFIIDFEYDREVTVTADKIRILQVIYNLVNNAINYTGDDKRVVIRQTVTDGYCRIEVSDSGPGIPEEELPMIWERYYKSSSFHKRAPLGTGLGLSIVKNILALHKSRFGVRSRVGAGSTFWFELPVVDERESGNP